THAVVGALMLAIPISAVALSAGAADARSAIQIKVKDRHLAFGERLRVTGNASSAEAGRRVILEFKRAGDKRWWPLRAATVLRDGTFRFLLSLKRSGRVRVVAVTPRVPPGALVQDSPNTTTIAPSQTRPIVVASKLHARNRARDVLDGQWTQVSGRLLPEV